MIAHQGAFEASEVDKVERNVSWQHVQDNLSRLMLVFSDSNALFHRLQLQNNMYMYLHEMNTGNTHEYDVTNLVAPQEAESVDPLGVTSL